MLRGREAGRVPGLIFFCAVVASVVDAAAAAGVLPAGLKTTGAREMDAGDDDDSDGSSRLAYRLDMPVRTGGSGMAAVMASREEGGVRSER